MLNYRKNKKITVSAKNVHSTMRKKCRYHARSAHPCFVEKTERILFAQLENLTKQKASIKTTFHSRQNVFMAFYKVAYSVAQTMAENLIFSAATDLEGIMIGHKATKTIKVVPSSNNTMHR